VLWSFVGAGAHGFFYQARKQPDTCAFACFNATLRDYGRIGLLMLGRGAIEGRRVVSESWVRRSTTPGAPYLRPSAGDGGAPPRFGYGYHWWIPPGGDGAFLAIGIFGQSIYVNPAHRLVVVQTAAWPVPVGDATLSAERAAVLRAIESAVTAR
jgi:CubicO group peptidase (beta-lactamase class C family)